MATLHLASAQDIAKAQKLTQMVEAGDLPKPPGLQGKVNTCANPKCSKQTMLARFYIPQIGYCCEACFDEWRLTPVWCDTHASDVHITRHYVPLGLFEIPDKTPAIAPQPSPAPRSEAKLPLPKKEPSASEKACRRMSESKGHWDAMWQAQQRWHEARNAGEARQDAKVKAAA